MRNSLLTWLTKPVVCSGFNQGCVWEWIIGAVILLVVLMSPILMIFL